MPLETFDGAAGTLPSPPWTDHALGTAWRRNGSGAAQPTATGQLCLAAYVGAGTGDALILTFGSTGGGDDYAGIACFIDGSDNFYTVEVPLGGPGINLNLFVAGAYSSTPNTWNTPGGVNQAVGDKIRVTCSLVGGDPHFVIDYWDASVGVPSWVSVESGYTHVTAATPGSDFGMFCYSGTAINNVLVNEWDDGNTSSATQTLAALTLQLSAASLTESSDTTPTDTLTPVVITLSVGGTVGVQQEIDPLTISLDTVALTQSSDVIGTETLTPVVLSLSAASLSEDFEVIATDTLTAVEISLVLLSIEPSEGGSLVRPKRKLTMFW